MKAFTKTKYGGPEILQLEEVKKPAEKMITSWLRLQQIQLIQLTGIFFGEDLFLHASLSDYLNQKIKFQALISQVS
jgi:hypothetical protein